MNTEPTSSLKQTKTKFLTTAVAGILLSASTASYANDQIDNKFGLYFGLGKASIESSKAQEEGIEDSATYLKLGFELQRSHWLFGAGFSGLFYDDNNEFKQTVQDYAGSTSTEDSSASASNLFAEAGYRYPVSGNIYADLFGGYEYIFSSERSIDNCSDCYSEDIEVESGLYLMPRIQYEVKNGLTLSLAYQHYLSGDIGNALMFTIGFSGTN